MDVRIHMNSRWNKRRWQRLIRVNKRWIKRWTKRRCSRLIKNIENDEVKFLISSVCIPLVILSTTILVGTKFSVYLQTQSHIWQQNHDGGIKTRMNLQEETVKFGYDISVLKKDIRTWEVTSGNRKIEPMFKKVEIKLKLLNGLSRQLSSNYNWTTDKLSISIMNCQNTVEQTKKCVVSNIGNRQSTKLTCAKEFKDDICNMIVDESFLVKENL